MFLFMLVITLIYIASLIWAFYSDKKDEALRQSSHNLELKKLENVFSFIEFTSTSDRIFTTKEFKAEDFLDCIITSEDMAKEHLHRSYERGYFMTKNNITIPVCQIKYARVITKLEV